MVQIDTDQVREFFITGLKDAHALEHQAMALMDRQLGHLENYPELLDRLQEHRRETEMQIERLDTLLGRFNSAHSVVKDTTMTLTGNLAALAHIFAPDEVVKNSFANFAFENFEIAAYRSLITVAELAGFTEARSPLEETLSEERAMADWLEQRGPELTRTYLARRSAGETASH